jgi:hypothetical protein
MATKRRKVNLARIKKLSTLLALGLRDLRKQERAKNCCVDMDKWLVNNGLCVACLAGSVMRWSLNYRDKCHFDAWSGIDNAGFDNATVRRLDALNYLRQGLLGVAAEELGIKTGLQRRFVASYKDDRDQWWSDMKQLLADLKSAGE